VTANPPGVWDASYKGVWHLSENAGGTAAIKDSTVNVKNSTTLGTHGRGAAGTIGAAMSFSGTTDADLCEWVIGH
jgi:hypothetical protein